MRKLSNNMFRDQLKRNYCSIIIPKCVNCSILIYYNIICIIAGQKAIVNLYLLKHIVNHTLLAPVIETLL